MQMRENGKRKGPPNGDPYCFCRSLCPLRRAPQIDLRELELWKFLNSVKIDANFIPRYCRANSVSPKRFGHVLPPEVMFVRDADDRGEFFRELRNRALVEPEEAMSVVLPFDHDRWKMRSDSPLGQCPAGGFRNSQHRESRRGRDAGHMGSNRSADLFGSTCSDATPSTS